ncbi:MAG TPA: DUF4421 domain-containing protein, partial [Chitinophagaceae bacterium]|nr:DUF4421 domain-containing protein [Chitinophagaceae bacterium]
MLTKLTALCALILCFLTVSAQKLVNDSSYYERYPDKLTIRLYAAQKFAKFTITPSNNQTDIEYKANTKLNLGIGFTYRNISANIFYGFAFLNKDTAKGETKGLDLQLQLYPRRWAIDLIALFPKGYYISPKGYASSSPNTYYHRPDVQLKLISVAAYKVPNKEKFSYRAAVKLSEWQKRSAGSPLYGGTIYYGTAKGDSALVPKRIESGFPQKGITNINFMALGAGGGYAYTLVIAKHFFITASAIANLDLTLTSEEGITGKHRKTSIGPSVVTKGGI